MKTQDYPPLLAISRRSRLPQLRAVYVVVGGDLKVLYVGQTRNLRARLSHHHHGRYFEAVGARIYWRPVKTETIGLALEYQWITQLNPVLNKVKSEAVAGVKRMQYITRKQEAWLRKEAKRRKTYVAVLIREAIDRLRAEAA